MKKLIVEKDKLKHNIDIIKNIATSDLTVNKKQPIIIAVLKGNGYGLGLLKFAEVLKENQINFFAVSEIQEAIHLRENGFTENILLLSSTSIKEEIELIVEYDIIPAMGSETMAKLLNETAKAQDKIIEVHLKIDTGFGRYGFLPEEIQKTSQLIKTLENIKISGVFSHLSFSFAKKRKSIQPQIDEFIKSIEILKQNNINPNIIHIANSCAFLRFKDMHFDAVRIGSAFLGRLPINNIYNFKKIAYLYSNISEIKTLPKNHYIGYANAYKTKKKIKIGIVPVGYKDGFGVEKSKDIFRFIDILRYVYHDFMLLTGNRAIYVKVNGEKARLIGRISMYNIVIDITDKDVNIGDEVILDINPLLIETSIDREYV